MSNREYDFERNTIKKALNIVNMLRNSQFALAIIETLLARNASAFQTIESVNFQSIYYFYSLPKRITKSKNETKNRIDTHVALLPEDAAKLISLPLEIREKPAQEIIIYVIDLLNAPVPPPQ